MPPSAPFGVAPGAAERSAMAMKKQIEYPVSAGGVVYRQAEGGPNGGLEVVLCGRRQAGTWSLPKGTPGQEETLEQTALREVQEETGLEVVIEESLGTIDYWFHRPPDRVRCHKTVHYYLMAPRGGSLELHDPEFDDVEWFPVREGLQAMTYANEAEVVRRAQAALARGGVPRG